MRIQLILFLVITYVHAAMAQETAKLTKISLNSNPLCSHIDFIQDNELTIKIEKRLCDGIESVPECLETIANVPKKTQEALLYYSYKKIQFLSSNLSSLKNKNQEAFTTNLLCYSQTLASYFNSKNFKKLDKNSLFDYYLPELFSELSVQENLELIKIWTPYIGSGLSGHDLLIKLKTIPNSSFRFFLISNFLTESYFDGLEHIEKYKLSQYILNSSLEVNLAVGQPLKLKVINYLNTRDISWEFPTDLILRFKNDPDFEPLFEKIFKLSQIKTRDNYLNYFSHDFNDLIASGKTAYPIRCALAKDFQTLISGKTMPLGNDKNKLIKDIIKNDIPCISQMKKTLLSFDTSSAEFLAQSCPAKGQCYQHFISNEWLQTYSTCQKDSDCKTLKYDNCERIFFNDQLPTNEIQLYSRYCQSKQTTDQALVNTPMKGLACLDNICQVKRF